MTTINYSALIRGWDTFTRREKFRALFEYRQVHPYKPPKERVKKVREPKPAFTPPPGYYRVKDLIPRLGRNIASVKRYVAGGGIRSYRVGHNVAYCEYDLIIARDRADVNRRAGKRILGVHNGSLNIDEMA